MEDQGPRITVYSCYFGVYEPFNPEATSQEGDHARVVFTDHPGLSSQGVTVQREAEGGDPGRLSRLAKLRPHLFFGDQDWVIYIDNGARLTVPPGEIVARIEAEYPGGAPAGRYLFRHDRRTCAYREARLCMRQGKIPRADYRRQVAHYQAAGFPENWGLFVNTVMIQKMGDPATDAFNDAWFDHYMAFSRRDQVSLPFMLWQKGYPLRVLPFAMTDVTRWPYFRRWKRLKFQAAEARKAANASG
jgi:hypothetical protein